MEPVVTTVLSSIAKVGAEALAKHIPLERAKKTRVDTSECHKALARHLEVMSNWAHEVSFRDILKSRKLTDSFIDLDLQLGRFATRNRSRIGSPIHASNLAACERHAVLLGDPGAGKTTSLKRIAIDILGTKSNATGTRCPLLLRLRNLSGETSLTSAVISMLGIVIHYDDSLSDEERENVRLRVVTQSLQNMSAVLLIDGLDELHPRMKDIAIRQLRSLLISSSRYLIIVTCRTGDFIYSFDAADVYVIEPLSDRQIFAFADKWLGKANAKPFLTQVREAPYGGTEVLPLTLAHLCAIYERTGSIPEKPRTVYRKIVRLLLEEWDEQRSIVRPSAYASFEVDRKEEFLRAVAYHLTMESRRGAFGHRDLQNIYQKICDSFGLPREGSRKVIREIESHTGLIVEVSDEIYEFAHKSIQEYLTAEFILRMPTQMLERSLSMPNEMALSTAMSSDPGLYFYTTISCIAAAMPNSFAAFTAPFIRRLLKEKVDFTISEDLGVACVALYSNSFFSSGSQLRLPFEVESEAFERLLGITAIASSVKLALQQASVEVQHNLLHVNWVDSPLPPSSGGPDRWTADRTRVHLAEHALQQLRNKWYTLDTTFFNSVGEDLKTSLIARYKVHIREKNN